MAASKAARAVTPVKASQNAVHRFAATLKITAYLNTLYLPMFSTMLSKIQSNAISALPKPVLDRIHRYAAEGRALQVSYEEDCCRLLAVTNWQLPAVILRSPKDRFPEMRSAAETEWTRARKLGRSKS